jgi:hypothetical protein
MMRHEKEPPFRSNIESQSHRLAHEVELSHIPDLAEVVPTEDSLLG